ncbi:hypothetical protein [Rhizobium brockwellii]|uniref:hypothetical protein n=1 Tax=Rhizobium brockwellii TaxID=3019932 RepID=UPI00293DD287|nr:hypothetical protein [Rhizobium brockwellii]MDV4159313.1 hypothetical protein [Rhizobium brockwellii]
MDRDERERIAAKRLLSVLGRHGAAIARTLEQKISDAGPFNQRIDPHILIPVRNDLVKMGLIQKIRAHGRDWFALPDIPPQILHDRIEEQAQVLHLTTDNRFMHRLGDALEIAVFRALRSSGLNSLGGFRGLADAPTIGPQKKEEPPSIFGAKELSGNRRFDFLVGTKLWAGIECKNIREWLYPDRPEIKQMLLKAVELDIPPILIGRRIPFVTRRLLQAAGGLVWEIRSQLYPTEYGNIAAQISHKDSLGFFDIRVTDYPDDKLLDFITRIIPAELPEATNRFQQFKDLFDPYARGHMPYHVFAAKIRRRENGTDEDRDDHDQPENPYDHQS